MYIPGNTLSEKLNHSIESVRKKYSTSDFQKPKTFNYHFVQFINILNETSKNMLFKPLNNYFVSHANYSCDNRRVHKMT